MQTRICPRCGGSKSYHGEHCSACAREVKDERTPNWRKEFGERMRRINLARDPEYYSRLGKISKGKSTRETRIR